MATNYLDRFEYLLSSPTVLIAIGICVAVFFTRIVSNYGAFSKTVDENGTKTVASVPYWIPVVGHIPNMAMDADGFLKRLRHVFPNGIFALNFGGGKHNILYSPGLATAFLNLKHENATAEETSKQFLVGVFGYPKEDLEARYDATLPELMTCYKHLLTEPSLGITVAKTAAKIKENIKNLVTGADSPVDQMHWEKISGTKMAVDKNGEPVVEASLLPLIRDFVAHNANAPIMGSDFLANHPKFLEDMWVFDRAFFLLLARLPRWLPIPMLTRAHIARKRILEALDDFHVAMDKEANGEKPEARWSSLDDVGALVKARVEFYRKNGWSIRARAATELSLLWAANANANALVFWMIFRIYSDRALLEAVREEIRPYVGFVQPEQKLAFPEPAQVDKFDIDGLCSRCPLLKSCYIECLRLDTASWSFKIVKQDFVLQSREKDTPGWLLRKGEFAHAAHNLHNTDPTVFEDPMVYRGDRHVKTEENEKTRTADMGSIRPYGGGLSMCKGRTFAFKECMMFAAAIVATWDIEPASSGEWKKPKYRKTTGVYGTDDDVRVWVNRR